MPEFETARRAAVRHLMGRGIVDARVLDAIGAVPRERFVPESLRSRSYDDAALPIEAGQTISQPYIVAVMASALELAATDRLLEVGAGSGYAACVFGRLAGEVWAVERMAQLALLAADRVEKLGVTNVHIRGGDGTLGLPEHAPYDAIVVSAGGARVPPALLAQLAPAGRLVMPVGGSDGQDLVRIRRVGTGDDDDFERDSFGSVRFVPLVGA